jgi:hypothetical protein
MYGEHQFIRTQFVHGQTAVRWIAGLFPKISRQTTLCAYQPENTLVGQCAPSSISYDCYKVFGKINFDLALHVVFALNNKTTLPRRIDYRRVDIRQTNDAKAVLREVFDWRFRSSPRVGPKLFPTTRHHAYDQFFDIATNQQMPIGDRT